MRLRDSLKLSPDRVDLRLGLRLAPDSATGQKRTVIPGQRIITDAFGDRNDRCDQAQALIFLGGDSGPERYDNLGVGSCDRLEVDLAAQDRRRLLEQRLGPGPDGAGIVAIPVADSHRLDAKGEKVVGAGEVERSDTRGRLLNHSRPELVLEGHRVVLREDRSREGGDGRNGYGQS